MLNSSFPDDGVKREILLSRQKIQEKVKELAEKITFDFKGKNPVFMGILKGSVLFFSDLVKEIGPGVFPEFDFLEISTYEGTAHKDSSNVEKDLSTDINRRNVLVIEDIVDKGFSLQATLKLINSKNPASVATCALLSKTEAREVEVPVEYVGFEIPNKWVEGYGLDTDEKFRNLPDIWYRI